VFHNEGIGDSDHKEVAVTKLIREKANAPKEEAPGAFSMEQVAQSGLKVEDKTTKKGQ
jgi:hypothetical protein